MYFQSHTLPTRSRPLLRQAKVLSAPKAPLTPSRWSATGLRGRKAT